MASLPIDRRSVLLPEKTPTDSDGKSPAQTGSLQTEEKTKAAGAGEKAAENRRIDNSTGPVQGKRGNGVHR
jgi:hypothetical protein